jgi:hypothetical protein
VAREKTAGNIVMVEVMACLPRPNQILRLCNFHYHFPDNAGILMFVFLNWGNIDLELTISRCATKPPSSGQTSLGGFLRYSSAVPAAFSSVAKNLAGNNSPGGETVPCQHPT